MKKKIYLLLGIVLLLGIILGYFIITSINKEDEDKQNVLEIQDVIYRQLGDSRPVIADFCNCVNEDYEIEIYFNGEKYEESQFAEIGEYEVIIVIDNNTYHTKVIVEDKEAPLLEIKEVVIKENATYGVSSFVVKCEDNSKKDCAISFVNDEMENYKKVGTYEIEIVARDESGNETKKQTNLTIEKAENTSSAINSSKEKQSSISNHEGNSTKNNGGNETSKSEANEKAVVTYKYGVKITTVGNKVTYDRTTFNAKTSDLKAEATQQKSKESNNINQILNATNKYRTEKGLSPLVLDSDMTVAANIRALEMAWGDEVSHTRPGGKSCFTVLGELGIVSFSSGENIAYGQKNGTSATTWWRNSSGHYANMMNVGFNKIGIGVYKFDGKYYYVQLFSS